MAEAFHRAGAATFFHDGNRLFKADNFERAVDWPTTRFSLLLLHHSNEDVWKETGREPGVTIRYTGGDPPSGGEDDRLWIRQRRIDSSSAALSEDEARQILNWAASDPRAALPAILQPPRSLEFLSALAILCQGYIAVHVKQSEGADQRQVSEALKIMGWDPGKHIGLVQEDPATVEDPGWWLDTFGVRSGEKIEPDKWDNFVKSVVREWGPGHKDFLQGEFIRSLGSNQPLTSPRLVAEAYLAIAKRIGIGRKRVPG